MVSTPLELERVVCYKKILMTEDEYTEYKNICRAYDLPHRKGESLFADLFEVNDEGRIIYIKSLSNRQSSFEVVFFVLSLMQNQWLRAAMNEVNFELKKIRAKNKILDSKLEEVDKRLQILDKKVPVKTIIEK